MTIPSLVGFGAFASAASASLSVAPPTGLAANDLLLLLVETARDPQNGASVVIPSGWSHTPSSSQGFGTAGTAGAIRLSVFYKFTTGTESNVSVTGGTDHTCGQMIAYRGVSTTSSFNTSSGVSLGTTTSIQIPTITTTVNECLIVNCIATDRDATATDTFSGWTNANLASLTERFDNATASGAGGGVAVADGTKDTAGLVGITTVTQITNVSFAVIALALRPKAFTLTAEAQAFAETGNAASLLRKYTLVSAGGSFTEVGNAATLKRALNLTSASGNFELTGVAASLLYGRRLVSALGTYSLTGNAATPRKTITLASSAGSFALTGIAASLKTTRYLSGGNGTFTLNGNSASFLKGYALPLAPGSFLVAGQPATLVKVSARRRVILF
jgi:hypothetical protein